MPYDPHIDPRTGRIRHRRSRRIMPAALVAVLALLGTMAARGYVDDRRPILPDKNQAFLEDLMDAVALANGDDDAEQIEFDEAAIFFEENATDGDLGIQFFFDGEGWDRAWIVTPGGQRMVDIKVKGSAGVIGLTEIFSESAEPSFDDLPRDEFIALFEEGEYLFFGKSVEGEWLVGEATLTNDLPDPPVIISPESEAEVPHDEPLLIEWETVADPDAPDSVVVAYQVIVEKDEDEERLRVWTIDMLPGETCVTVPSGFLEPGKAYKFEILVEESSGNKVISEVEFETEEDD